MNIIVYFSSFGKDGSKHPPADLVGEKRLVVTVMSYTLTHVALPGPGMFQDLCVRWVCMAASVKKFRPFLAYPQDFRHPIDMTNSVKTI